MFEQFPITSRYHRIATTTLEIAGGKSIRYLKRRFLPSVSSFSLLREHTVVEGDRLDLITAQHLGDPEQFWRVCDANNAVRPDDLLEVGRKLRITLPEGIPGYQE
jgi:nucleoid-associated protein YgaU